MRTNVLSVLLGLERRCRPLTTNDGALCVLHTELPVYVGSDEYGDEYGKHDKELIPLGGSHMDGC